jgi:UPF0755 protein
MAGFFLFCSLNTDIPMKKGLLGWITLSVLLLAALAGWMLLGPAGSFAGDSYSLYIRTGMDWNHLNGLLQKDEVMKSPWLFRWLAKRLDYPAHIRAGKYELAKDMNLLSILRLLHNGKQSPVNLVITKLRTKEDLASQVGRKLECDSSVFHAYLENNDSLREFGLDSNTVMTAVFPNTYTYFWNSTPARVFRKMYASYKAFWTADRLREAEEHGLSRGGAYILSSIVEEETTRSADKGKIASVYLNRLSRHMKLAADPTIKYALRDFELRRIYDKYLSVESPYNTYKYEGLPPGPICTPSEETLDAVLKSPQTNYLFFVAKPDFSGYSNFSENLTEHLQYARQYQKALDDQMKTHPGSAP